MSWNPFKKARRTRADDVEFEREMNKLRQMQAVSKRMYKDMRKCNEAETTLLRSKQKVILDVKSSPLGKTDPLKHTVEVLGTTMEDLYSHSKTLKTNQDITFTEPIKKFNRVYKQVEYYAKQRELKLQEYERQQSKLEKQGRKASNPQTQAGGQAKLDLMHRSLASAKSDYERIHGRLTQEMPELYENRVAYFDHCLEAVIKAQALYYHQCSESLSNGLSKLQGGSSEIRSEEELQKETERHLDEIRALSIVGTTPG